MEEGRIGEMKPKGKAKRARKAETPKQPSFYLKVKRTNLSRPSEIDNVDVGFKPISGAQVKSLGTERLIKVGIKSQQGEYHRDE